MTGKWFIGSTDLSTLGIYLLRNSTADMMSPPVPKRRLEHDWQDQNGVSVDTTSALKYEAKRYRLRIVITAANKATFWSRYNSLLTLINKPGTFTMSITDLGIGLVLLYEGMKMVSRTRNLSAGRVAVEYELSVLEPNPTTRTYD